MGSFKGRASKPVLKCFDTGIQKFHYGVHLLLGIVIGRTVFRRALISVQLGEQPDAVVLEYHKTLCRTGRVGRNFHPDLLRRNLCIDQLLELFGSTADAETCNAVERRKNLSRCHRSYQGVAVGEGVVKGKCKSISGEIHRKRVVVQKGHLYIGLLEVGKDRLPDVLRERYNRASATSRQGPLTGVRRGCCCEALGICINVEHQTDLRFLKSALRAASPLRQLS